MGATLSPGARSGSSGGTSCDNVRIVLPKCQPGADPAPSSCTIITPNGFFAPSESSQVAPVRFHIPEPYPRLILV